MLANLQRRRFRFSLRTLFVIVTLLCVWLGWNLNIVRERRIVRDRVVANGGSVLAGEQGATLLDLIVESTPVRRAQRLEVEHIKQRCEVSLGRRWLGDEAVYRIDMPTADAREILAAMDCFPESEIWANGVEHNRDYQLTQRRAVP